MGQAEALSVRQRSIIDFVSRFRLENGYPPSIRDIVDGCSISSTSVVDYNLNILEKLGFIRRHREVSRGIELVARLERQPARRSVPIIGQIAAGAPIPVPEADAWDTAASADTIEVTDDLIRGKSGVYALRVKGDSMVEDLISDGDIVLMQATNAVDNGETAAVWLRQEREVTLKRVYVEADRIRLQPANARMQPIYTALENVAIQGRVVAVIRRLP